MNQAQFDIWFDGQRPERINIAFNRAAKKFDTEYWSMSTVDDYMDDEDFMLLFADELSDMAAKDLLHLLADKGILTLEVQEDGSLIGYPVEGASLTELYE